LTASDETRMLRPPNRQRRTTGGNFVRKKTVKLIRQRGGAAVGAMREDNTIGAKSAGSCMY
jgi:hypothetical protein